MEAVDATLRKLAAKFEEAVNRPVPDPKQIEDLARRIDAVGGVAERGFAPHAARLETALADIRAKVEEAAERPEFDARPIEELSRRIDVVRNVAERSFAPHAARLETALADIRAQFDRPTPEIDAALRELAARIEDAISRPATVSLDPRPIEELARRIESVRESLDKPQALSPQAERLESALGAVADRLDRAPVIDAQGINSALAAMNARLEEAFRRPAQAEIDREPIEALAARVDAVRESVERQAEQFDIERLEEALRSAAEKLERPGVGPEEFRAVVTAIQALAAKIDNGAAAVAAARVEDLMERVADRLDRPGPELTDAIADLMGKVDRPGPDLSRLEALMEQAATRLDPPTDLAAVAEAIAELSARLDRESGAPRAALLEELVQDVAVRLEGIENKLDGRPGEAGPSDDSLAQLELGVRDLAERLGDLGGVAQELRALQDRIDDLEPAGASGALVEQTSQAIARELATRLPAANPEALLGHLQDIHERLDAIASLRPGPAALEQAMIELTEELEAFRSAREAVGRGAATLSEMRAEQLQFDRRMDARFSGVQEILEKLVEKLDRGANTEPPPAPATVGSRAAMLDIPDRSGAERRPTSAPSLEAPPIVAQARGREAAEGNSAKAAAINAHIAAARRAANAAADGERRDDAEQARSSAQEGLTQRAATLFSQHRRPVLLGVAGLMTVLTGVAVLEMRAHAPVRKSELDLPVSPLAQAGTPTKDAAIDNAPTGSISPPAKVIAAPLPPAPKVETIGKGEPTNKPAAALVAALPAGLGGALVAAGSKGDVGAEVEIAQRFLEGRGAARDPKAASAWMQAAADAGNAFAQYRLGAMYEKGVGVARDAAKARELYKKAADAGNARAMHNLAVLYAQDGGDGKPDYAAAIDWFHKAASYGVRDSQFNLGVLYGRGLGASQSLAESWMWFSLAARQGDTDAARKRDEVENRMDGRALAEGKKLLDGFKAKTPAPAANDAPPAPASAASAPPADTKAAGVKG
jgi:localization factor PodJL